MGVGLLEDMGQPEMEVGPARLAVLLLDRVGEVMVGSANPDQSDLGKELLRRHAVTLLMELGLRASWRKLAQRGLHSLLARRSVIAPPLRPVGPTSA